MKLFKCEQCGSWEWRQRSTKRFCSNACKQKNKRGTAPTDVYDIWTNPQEIADLDTLTRLAENDRSVFAALQRMKEKYGNNAMLAALHILQDYSA